MRLLLGFLVFCAWASFARYHYVCKIKNNCNPVEETVAPKAPINTRPKTLSLKSGDEYILKDYEQFAFKNGSVNPNPTANNKDFIEKVADYLKKNEDKNLTIMGYYRESEKNTASDMYENLGLARAAAIRSLLERRGIQQERISLDFNSITGDKLIEPATFELYAAKTKSPDEFDKDGTRLAKVQFSFHDMTYSDANFEYDSDVFKPKEAFLAYADSVKTYLELNTDKTLTIIGHTDNVGSHEYNDGLGMRRAKSTKEYFIKMGAKSPIKIMTKGKREPMAPNDTEENRLKNRRVNFKIE